MEKVTTHKIGVVLVSWKIPEQRLQAHFRWNAELYGETGATVFVVTDREYDLPDYAMCVVYPEDRLPRHRGERMFSLTRTKNAGVRAAIDAGCDPIICTDVDVLFERDAWEASLNVEQGSAVVPVHWMSYADEEDRRYDRYKVDPGCPGTVAMTARDWRKCPYHERQWGYSLDDWLVVQRIVAASIKINRSHHVFHMAHIDGAEQDQRGGRDDHWNRDSGVNPYNRSHNQRFMMPNGVDPTLLVPDRLGRSSAIGPRVCVVGQGPSAEGQGELIDGCDFVVRMKAFWLRGAEDAGSKIDAWAWFGMTKPDEVDHVPEGDIRHHVPEDVEHWFTDCITEVVRYQYYDRLRRAKSLSGMPIFHIDSRMRNQAAEYLHSHPTTGFLTVCMAVSRMPAGELILCGFDSTEPAGPNFEDARGVGKKPDKQLDFIAEKRAFAEIREGSWLGQPTDIKLKWIGEPNHAI